MLSIHRAARYLGVSIPTLRRWDKAGLLSPTTTIGGHRRYRIAQLDALGGSPSASEELIEENSLKITYIYGRVSTYRQQEVGNLDRQIARLLAYHRAHFGPHTPYVAIKEYGSGLNCQRKGLWRLLQAVKAGKVRRVLIAYKDRLTRFGFDFVAEICALYGVPIVEVEVPEAMGLEQQLVTDMRALIASFSGKLYKLRALEAVGGASQDRQAAAAERAMGRAILRANELTEQHAIAWCLNEGAKTQIRRRTTPYWGSTADANFKAFK